MNNQFQRPSGFPTPQLMSAANTIPPEEIQRAGWKRQLDSPPSQGGCENFQPSFKRARMVSGGVDDTTTAFPQSTFGFSSHANQISYSSSSSSLSSMHIPPPPPNAAAAAHHQQPLYYRAGYGPTPSQLPPQPPVDQQNPGQRSSEMSSPPDAKGYQSMNSLLGSLHMMRRQRHQQGGEEPQRPTSGPPQQPLFPQNNHHQSLPTQQQQQYQQVQQHQNQSRPSRKRVTTLRINSNLY